MRKDMYKVIVERPRHGGHGKGESRRIDATAEESPSREGIRDRHRDRKWLNENLRPLQRWLGSQVGRPWNKVFSELCAGIDRRNTVQQHIHQHIGDFVAVRVVYLDGVAHQVRDWWHPQPLARYWAPAYWVDPDSGILRHNRWRLRARRDDKRDKAQHRAPPTDRRELSPWQQLHRLRGVWYLVELAAIPATEPSGQPAFDALRHLPVRFAGRPDDPKFVGGDIRLFGRDQVYAKYKRQLSARELRQHGLQNAPTH